MRTDVLQMVALSLHGNAYLADSESDRAPELLGANSLFKSVFEITFERKSNGSRHVITLGNTVARWLRRLKGEGVQQFRLSLASAPGPTDRVANGSWGIVTDGNGGTELWSSTWKGRLVRYDEPPSWNVIYHADRFNRWALPLPTPGDEAYSNLGTSLSEMQDVCSRLGDADLAELCARCLEMHLAENSRCPGFPDLVPAHLSRHAQNLVASGVRAMMVLNTGPWIDSIKRSSNHEFREKTAKVWLAAMHSLDASSCVSEWQAKAS